MKVKFPKIPRHEMEAMARVMLPAIREYFQSEEGRQEYETWKREREVQGKHIES